MLHNKNIDLGEKSRDSNNTDRVETQYQHGIFSSATFYDYKNHVPFLRVLRPLARVCINVKQYLSCII